MATGGGPPLEDKEYDTFDLKIQNMFQSTEIEGDKSVVESEVIFENEDIFIQNIQTEEPESNIEFDHHYFQKTNVEKLLPTSSSSKSNKSNDFKSPIEIVTKSQRLGAALKVSDKIAEEISEKTMLKREYYKSKIEISKENLEIKNKNYNWKGIM